MANIRPSVTESDVYEGKSFQATPDGTHKMAIAGISVRKTSTGNDKLSLFMKHTEAKGYNGVNGDIVITGQDKNGKDNSARLGQLFLALGVAKEDMISGKTTVEVSYDEAALASADWKGVPATLIINGDALNAEALASKSMLVSTETVVRNGTSKARAKSFYPLKA